MRRAARVFVLASLVVLTGPVNHGATGTQPRKPNILLMGAELYNLSQDIGETKNLATARPGKVKELADAWQRWNTQLAKPLWGPGSTERGTR